MAFSGGFVSDLRVKKAIRMLYYPYVKRVMLFLSGEEAFQLPVILRMPFTSSLLLHFTGGLRMS